MEKAKVFVIMPFADEFFESYASMESLAMTPQWQLFVNGEITAEEALKTAEEQGNAVLAEAAMDY